MLLPLLLAALAVSGQSPQTQAPQVQQLCGTATAIACDATKPTLLTLLVQPGIAVRIVAATAGNVAAILNQLDVKREERVCVTGSLIQRQNAVSIGVFAVAAATDIVPQPGAPSDWPTADVYTDCDRGFHPVNVKSGVRPSYTESAMKANIQGTALVQAIVGVDGAVERVRLVKSLDPVLGLDEEALKAARQWKFTPGTRDGQPVRALITLELTFQLRK